MISRPSLRLGELLTAAFILTVAAPAILPGQTDPRVAARLDSLERAVKTLTRLRTTEADSLKRLAATRPSVSIGAEGFQLRSADSAFRLKITGYLQADGRFYLDEGSNAGINTLLIRRARPIIEGTVYKFFDFRLMPDFGQGSATIYEAFLEARLSSGVAIRAGKFKPPIGLERLQSATDLRFAERGFPTNLAPNRDVGLQIGGELASGRVQYAGGVFNGVADLGFGDLDGSDAKDLAGRLFLVPFANRGRQAPVDIGFGLAMGTGNERGTLAAPTTSTLRTPGQLVAFRYRSTGLAASTVVADGRRTRIAPQAYFYRGPLGVLGEYTISRHTNRLDQTIREFAHNGWQVSGSVVLTGERQSFGGISPRRAFDPSKRQWGALELAARYQGTGVDAGAFPTFADLATSVSGMRAWSFGLNWHLARRVKVMVNYEHTRFTGGAPNGGNRPPEKFLVTRFQTAF